MKEVSAMKRLNHEHIVKYYGSRVTQYQHKSGLIKLMSYYEFRFPYLVQ